ncbi:MAG: SRPBCC domain-containing protein [Crocinitomicaceae bacterium]|nr:SRPBCC domain-containing protein [Crocinitomicaceae bacterium]
MKDFDWTEFTKRIAVKASMKEIYDAWTIPAEIEKWFLSNADYFDGETQLDKTKHVEGGNTYAWSWYNYDIIDNGDVVSANGNDFFQFTFAGDCLVDVKLQTQGEYTIVELTQKGIPTDDSSKRGIRLGCDTGWSFFMVNLKSVYEGGVDLRHKEPGFKGLINY